MQLLTGTTCPGSCAEEHGSSPRKPETRHIRAIVELILHSLDKDGTRLHVRKRHSQRAFGVLGWDTLVHGQRRFSASDHGIGLRLQDGTAIHLVDVPNEVVQDFLFVPVALTLFVQLAVGAVAVGVAGVVIGSGCKIPVPGICLYAQGAGEGRSEAVLVGVGDVPGTDRVPCLA